MDEKTIIVAAKCIHCNKEVVGTKDSFDKVWNNHLDNCDGFKSYIKIITELHEKDLLQPTLKLFKIEKIEKSLKRLIKKHKTFPDELIEILEGFALCDERRVT